MEVKVNKKFLKDLAKIPVKHREKIESFVFEQSETFESIEETGIFEKLKGYDQYYKAKFGNYRIGVNYTGNTLTFERVLHRKDVYRYFP